MTRYGPDAALIVVDVQNDFADPAGGLSRHGRRAVIEAVNREIEAARERGAVVVATQDWHPEHTPHFARDGGVWPVHCVADTWGAELHPALALPGDAPRVRKGANGEDGYSGFTMRDPVSGETIPTELERLLRAAGVGSVVVVGLATDYCVKATALDAVRLGFRTTVLTDAIAAVDLQPGDGERALEEIEGGRRHTLDRPPEPDRVEIHLVDATYELFRAHFAPRPPVLGRDGIVLSGVSGLVEQLLYLLREEGATHVGCATDRVIESFRNDLFAGYKSSAGMPPELLAQFPIAEAAVEALGIALWPMVEFEADDAIAAAAVRFAETTPAWSGSWSARRTRTWPSSSGTRGSCCGTAAERSSTTTPGSGRNGAWPRPRSPTTSRSSAIRRMAIPGCRAGAPSPPRPCCSATGISRTCRRTPRPGRSPGSAGRGPSRWPHPFASIGRCDALPRPGAARTADDGVQIRQHDPDELRWDGAPRAGLGGASARSGASNAWSADRTAGGTTDAGPTSANEGQQRLVVLRPARPGSRSSAGCGRGRTTARRPSR